MKKLNIYLFGMLLIAAGTAQAQVPSMQDFCSAPPYVSRNIAPNVMILMDNSADMMQPAYTDAYQPITEKSGDGIGDDDGICETGEDCNVYTGYFKPQSCYTYDTNKFVEVFKTHGVNVRISYTATDICPSGATGYLDNGTLSGGAFRGNVMNWATTSKFDLLQKVLIGGNSASKQGNAHTLVSIGGTFPDKTYNGCIFRTDSANLYLTEASNGNCVLLGSPPAPIAFWQRSPVKEIFAWFSRSGERVSAAASWTSKKLLSRAARLWDRIELVSKAYAAQLVITRTSAVDGLVGTPYSVILEGSGNNNCIYSWSTSFSPSTPGWITGPVYTSQGNRTNYRATWTGTPDAAGTYTLNVTMSNNKGDTPVTASYQIVITAPTLQIVSVSLPSGEKGKAYYYQVIGQGGVPPYTWSATGLPTGLTINAATGEITGAASVTGTFSVTIRLTDATAAYVESTIPITITAPTGLGARSASFNVKVDLIEETLTDLNGNDIWDPGESYTELNGNGQWDGKQGVFQKFWDSVRPKARWGLTKFKRQGSDTLVDLDSCIPAAPVSSFLTRIQNATPTTSSPLAKGLYGVINYFGQNMFTGADMTSFSGCNNSDPIDNVPCRKNFVLVITSGSDLTGASYAATCTVDNGNASEPLVQDACFGKNTDLRSDKASPPNQNLYTYVVNTFGGTNAAKLQDAAQAGGGKYYDASQGSNLEKQLVQAIQDILGQAASGTAVSVLTTSSRGVGSVVQAYFLPTRQEGDRSVWWTGYMQNIWIDPQDNLREDTDQDTNTKTELNLGIDKVMRLHFNKFSNETEAALFTTTADGSGGSLAECSSADPPTIKSFSEVKALWEAGRKLALRAESSDGNGGGDSRQIFTAVPGGVGINTVLGYPFTVTDISANATLTSALRADGTYTAGNIIKYVRGIDLESTNANYRDRRLTVNGTPNIVWKLGDVINSTPKVLSTLPANTYIVDYNDISYYNFAASSAVKQRSSIAFVGGNDGMMHAFRVGYLKDTGLAAEIKGLFKNLFSSGDEEDDKIGEEIWAYIPYHALPYLKYLASTDYGSCHLYYVDQSVRIVDASFGGVSNPDPGDVRDATSWRTILIGGMRFGGACAESSAGDGTTPKGFEVIGDGLGDDDGICEVGEPCLGLSSYFALDVTNPEEPKPLWEFTDADLGYTSGYPSIVRTGNRDINGNWYLVVGSGSKVQPKSGVDINRTSTGYIYVIDLETGVLAKKIGLGHNAIVGDVLSVDKNDDYVSEKVYFGTSYKDAGVWKGKVMSIVIPDQALDSAWTPTITTHFSGNYPFTASPDAVKDEEGNLWVYAGSGKYFSDEDENDGSQQIFIGFKELGTSVVTEGATTATSACPASCPSSGGELCNVTNCTTTGVVSSTIEVCAYDKDTNSYGKQEIVTSVSGASGSKTTAIGWKIYLSASERVITRPLAIGGLVDFLTYVPNSDLCSYGGESYLYSVNYTSGIAPSSVAIRAPGSTSGTTGSVTVEKRVPLGKGAPPTGEAIIIPPQKEGQEQLKKKIQIATGVIIEAENKPIISTATKVIHWLRK